MWFTIPKLLTVAYIHFHIASYLFFPLDHDTQSGEKKALLRDMFQTQKTSDTIGQKSWPTPPKPYLLSLEFNAK